jgi:hypothetical protein
MTTICPWYEGSVTISWYPHILVLKTTSAMGASLPSKGAGNPNPTAVNTVPSSRRRKLVSIGSPSVQIVGIIPYTENLCNSMCIFMQQKTDLLIPMQHTRGKIA